MMGKQEKRVLTLDRYEHGVVVNALNEMRSYIGRFQNFPKYKSGD